MEEKLEYQKYKNLRDSYEEKVNRFANIRLILFLVVIFSFIVKYYYYPFFFQLVFAVSFVLFIIIILVHDKYFKVYDYYVKYVEVLERYLDCKNGKWKNFEDKGEEFLVDDKAYLADLDILGNCSLFQYLSVCKTLGGRERLVAKLSNLQISASEWKENQEAVRELAENISFMVDFQVMLKHYDKKKIHLERDFSYLDKGIGKRTVDFIIGIIASVICVILFLLGCLKIVSFSYFYGMFFFNLLISYLYAFIFKEEFASLDKTVLTYGKLQGVFLSFDKAKFQSVKLKKMQKRIRDGLDDIVILHRVDSFNSLRNNLLASLFFNGFGCFNLFLLYYYAKFLNHRFGGLKAGIHDIEEMEAMVSLATIGVVRDEYCLPDYQDKVGLSFENIKHPLLDEMVCVGNDFEMKAGVNIITGSNMGGKTSFLRMIGINLILMQAGGFVCAKSFSASYFKIFTSMRIADNIEKGISTFYGELLRIQGMVQYVNEGNMLVLIDEIFKGTNYQDRMYGAREVIRKLNTKNTIAFITTHDFELCEESGIRNYHVKEDYEGDKIIFDYKIRTGKVKSTNAKYLMKKLGIID